MPFHGKRKHGGRADWLNTLGIILGIGLLFVPVILILSGIAFIAEHAGAK